MNNKHRDIKEREIVINYELAREKELIKLLQEKKINFKIIERFELEDIKGQTIKKYCCMEGEDNDKVF